MRTLKNVRTDPPGGWTYTVPETTLTITAGNFWKLMTLVKEHYSVNDLKVPDDLEEQVNDYICRRIPGNFCTGEGPIAPVPDRKTFDKGTQAHLRKIYSIPGNKASREDTIERIPVCTSCVYNNNRLGCFKCTDAYNKCAAVFPGIARKNDRVLVACDIFSIYGLALCGSSEVLIKTQFGKFPLSDIPDNCWIKHILMKEPDNG